MKDIIDNCKQYLNDKGVKVKGCYNEVKLVSVECRTVNSDLVITYLLENQENFNQYTISVRYKGIEELTGIHGLMVEGIGKDSLNVKCFPVLDDNLSVKALMYMGILTPDVLPVVIHLILDKDDEKTEVLKTGISKELYDYVFDTFQGTAKGLDYHKDIELHIMGTCECLNH
jgi:hypothetical protein